MASAGEYLCSCLFLKGACLCDRLWNAAQAKWAKDSEIHRLSGFWVLLVSLFVSLYGDGHSVNKQTPDQELPPGMGCHPHLPAN